MKREGSIKPGDPCILEVKHGDILDRRTLKRSVHGVRDEGYGWAQKHGLPLKTTLVIAIAKYPTCCQ
jgi:hypothetical protein